MNCPRLDCNGTVKKQYEVVYYLGVDGVMHPTKRLKETNFDFCVECGCVIYKERKK